MRGCLSVLVLGVTFLAAIVWVAGPPLASGIVTIGLQGSGLSANHLDVQVTADPPLKLAIGRADRIVIRATEAQWKGVRFASIDVTLGAVDLLGRTATSADGRLTGVELDTSGSQAVVADVDFNGAADAAATTIRVAAANVEAAAIDAFEAHFGVRPSSVKLVAPDSIRVTLGPLTITSRLSIDAKGSVVAVASGDTIVLFTPNPALPLNLNSLAVTASGLELRGTLEVGALLR